MKKLLLTSLMLLSVICADKAVAAVTPIAGYTTPQTSTAEDPVWYTMMSSHLTAANRQNRFMQYNGTDLCTVQFNSGMSEADITDAYLWRLESAGDGTESHVYIVNKGSGLRISVPANATAEDGSSAVNTPLEMAEEGSVWDLKTSKSTGLNGDCADGQYCFQYVAYSGNAFLNAMDEPQEYGITIYAAGVHQASGWFFYEYEEPVVEVVADPVFSPADGESFVTADPVTITITTETEDAQIYYTVDGTEPSADNGKLYVDGAVITESCTIKAIAVKEGMTSSSVVSATYEITAPVVEVVADPVFSPADGESFVTDDPVTIIITTETEDAQIYYTVDGTEPSADNGKLYVDGAVITESCTIKAIAVKEGMTSSSVVSATYEITAPEYCTLDLYANRDDRSLSSITMNGGVEPFTISSIETSANRPIYHDYTDNVLRVYPGAEIQPEISWKGEWMHGYLYIDYDGDKSFSYELNEDGTPAEGSEIVSYTYYRYPDDNQPGTNSLGESTAADSKLDNVPAFTVPEDLEPGQYRIRFKIDWDSLDPCGNTDLNDQGIEKIVNNGGSIVDFTLQVEIPDYVVTVAVNDESMGIAYIGEEGTTTATSPHEGTGTLVLTAVASEGYQFDGWYLGEELVSEEAVYSTTAITEDRDYVAAFSRIIMNYTVTVNNTTPDGGSITLSYTEGGAAVQSGDQVEEGTSLTVTVTPNAQMELSSLVINGEECADDYTAEGYVFTVEDDTEITVAFAAQVFTLEFSSTGGGHIEIWTAMDDTGWYPGGTQYESGDEVIGSMIYIFSYPEGREELESLTINGEPQDISELEFWGSIGYKVEEDVNIVAVFSGETPSGVEEAAADAVKVYSAAGAIVIESGEAVSADIYTAGGVLVKSVTSAAGTDRIDVPDGIYMVKVGAKVQKVAVR